MTLRLYTLLTGLAFFWLTSIFCVVPESERLVQAQELGAQIWDEIPGTEWVAIINDGAPVKGETPEPPSPPTPNFIRLVFYAQPPLTAHIATVTPQSSGLWVLSRRERLLQSPSTSPPNPVHV